MKRAKRWIVAWLLLAGLMWTAVIPLVWAHGGGLIHVAGAPVGPYRVTVWVAPNTVEADKTLHFTVAVVQPDGNRPVLDAQVMMTVLPAGGETAVLSGPATTAQSINKLFYEADFTAPPAGAYQVQTQVIGPDGEGMVSFDLAVEPARRTNLLFIGVAGLLLIAGLGIFLARRGAKAPAVD